MGNYLDGVEKEYCSYCGLNRTEEGYDGCIGFLQGVKNACCGHGETKMAYVQFDNNEYQENPNKIRISGKEALEYIRLNKR